MLHEESKSRLLVKSKKQTKQTKQNKSKLIDIENKWVAARRWCGWTK